MKPCDPVWRPFSAASQSSTGSICCARHGIPCGQVRTVAQALEDPQLQARDMILDLDHPKAGRLRVTGTPIKLSAAYESIKATAPPTHGQHNREVFCDLLGLSAAELESLRREEVI